MGLRCRLAADTLPPQAAEKQISRIVFVPHGTISALTPVKSRYRPCEVELVHEGHDSLRLVVNSDPLALNARCTTYGARYEDQSFGWLGRFRRIWAGSAVGMADFTLRVSAGPGTDCAFDFWRRHGGIRNTDDVS